MARAQIGVQQGFGAAPIFGHDRIAGHAFQREHRAIQFHQIARQRAPDPDLTIMCRRRRVGIPRKRGWGQQDQSKSKRTHGQPGLQRRLNAEIVRDAVGPVK